MKYDKNTEYWREGNTVIDRDGNIIIGHLRSDRIKSEKKAKAAADKLNAGQSMAQVREWLKH